MRAVLVAGAADTDLGVRRLAVGALVRSAPEAAGGAWGRRGRYDPSEYVKRATIDALGGRTDDEAALALLKDFAAAGDVPPWTRARAAVAIARRGPGERAFLAGIAASNPTAGAQLAGALAGDEAARVRLGERLAEGGIPLELWFFDELGRSGIEGVGPPLTVALDTLEPELRLAAAGALLGLDAGAARAPLLQALRADEDTALEALEVLRDVEGPAATEILREALAGGTELTRGVARMAVLARGDGDLREAARVLDEEEDGELQAAAAWAIGARLGRDGEAKAGAREALRARLGSPDVSLQLAAVRALGRSREPEDRQALLAVLDDESMLVAVTAADQLAR